MLYFKIIYFLSFKKRKENKIVKHNISIYMRIIDVKYEADVTVIVISIINIILIAETFR